jgi:hypothetical protein
LGSTVKRFLRAQVVREARDHSSNDTVRNAITRMALSNAMSITPEPPLKPREG